MFRGSELPRLMGMLVLLAVLGMVVFRARDPATWQWLVHDSGSSQVEPEATVEPPPPSGPTDEDLEQLADAAEEFQALSDGTIGIQPEEMFAYWRLLLWVENQSLERLQHRAKRNVPFTELMQRPGKHRAQLVSLELNVRRVLSYDIEDSLLPTQRFYEVWGWTDDSKAWLYCVVTAHLPEGMSVGPSVEERARFVGYFFKLQGYLEAGAKPRAKPLRAPLLVGRLSRYPTLTEVQASTGWDWASIAVVAAAGVVLAGAIGFQVVHNRRSARHQVARQGHAGEMVRQWLQEGFPAPEVGAADDQRRETGGQVPGPQ